MTKEERKAVKAMEMAFHAATRIPLPSANTKAESKLASVRWWQPLRRMFNMSGDLEKSISLLNRACDQLITRGMSVSAPASIEKTFISLFAESERAEATGFW